MSDTMTAHEHIQAALRAENGDDLLLTHWVLTAGAVRAGDADLRFIGMTADNQPGYVSAGLLHEHLHYDGDGGDDD